MKAFQLLILIVLLLTFSATVKAADLQVSVFEVLSSSGSLQPIVGARVCVGTQSDPAQVGSLVMNDNSGQVTFHNVSPGQWIVTVSADGYRGQQSSINITGNFASSSFSMDRCARGARGDCGPTCNGGNVSNRPDPRQPPNGDLTTLITRISDFYINHKEFEPNDPTRRKPSLSVSRDVKLYFNYTGVSPTQYRASESSDFENTTWNNLPPQSSTGDPFVNYTLIAGGPARRTVYFQVRAGSSLGGLLSLNSNVAEDRVDLQLSRMKTYAFSGRELIELLNFARDQGFTFGFRDLRNNGPMCKRSRSTPGDEFDQMPGFSEGTDINLPGVRISAQQNNSGGERRWVEGTLLQGRQLNASWSVVNHIFGPGKLWNEADSGTSFTIEKNATKDDPSFTVRFRFNRKGAPFSYGGNLRDDCSEANILLILLSLEGPEGGDWHDAFRRN